MWDLLFGYPTVPGVIAGAVLLAWPPPRQPTVEIERQARLAELARGAPEQYFEERRALETYGPRSSGPYRFWGLLLLVLSAAPLLLRP